MQIIFQVLQPARKILKITMKNSRAATGNGK